ncbi:TauD/TfdA dioxygenase family protein [Nitrobacter winogradskyi]|uniref:Taurine dioxygenase n=2 Tax=Nitrobacter winogradskyi TaxID=913 RepID=A0ACC6AKG9_NITWI|nr:TauD/TfdA family dioxygenase [Nitrobacter winogradskyi]MCP1999998.1 taurine dioxygenase [Nitrobacter winogradskyi]GEC16625.1 alpha-ketoglutarate-dependent taurine dioxygenase [Nitrobacter winogradskyi]
MNIKPSERSLGATIEGVTLSEIDLDGVRLIRAALMKHLVLVFPRQILTSQQLVAVARMFGAVKPHGFLAGMENCPEVLAINKRPGDAQNFGGAWHTDNSYLPAPPMGALLHAQVVPSFGGDTEWSNQYEALMALPESIRIRIDHLWARHESKSVFGALPSVLPEARQQVAIHPLVCLHPETRRATLFHSGACTVGFEGMDDAEATCLGNDLLAVATHPDLTFRHSWRPGDLVFWDNRCTMHRALNDYLGQTRLMHRVSICGTPPLPISL